MDTNYLFIGKRFIRLKKVKKNKGGIMEVFRRVETKTERMFRFMFMSIISLLLIIMMLMIPVVYGAYFQLRDLNRKALLESISVEGETNDYK